MTGPEGNSFVFSENLAFSVEEVEGTSRFRENKTNYFPRDQSLSVLLNSNKQIVKKII